MRLVQGMKTLKAVRGSASSKRHCQLQDALPLSKQQRDSVLGLCNSMPWLHYALLVGRRLWLGAPIQMIGIMSTTTLLPISSEQPQRRGVKCAPCYGEPSRPERNRKYKRDSRSKGKGNVFSFSNSGLVENVILIQYSPLKMMTHILPSNRSHLLGQKVCDSHLTIDVEKLSLFDIQVKQLLGGRVKFDLHILDQKKLLPLLRNGFRAVLKAIINATQSRVLYDDCQLDLCSSALLQAYLSDLSHILTSFRYSVYDSKSLLGQSSLFDSHHQKQNCLPKINSTCRFASYLPGCHHVCSIYWR